MLKRKLLKKQLRKENKVIDKEINHLITLNLFTTITNANFDKKVIEILAGKNPDTFTISLKETVEKFDSLDCIYIAHYFVKKPNLGDEEFQILTDLVPNSKRILKEATNAISAGIYISHGHNSIYGSDVHNWDDYIRIV